MSQNENGHFEESNNENEDVAIEGPNGRSESSPDGPQQPIDAQSAGDEAGPGKSKAPAVILGAAVVIGAGFYFGADKFDEAEDQILSLIEHVEQKNDVTIEHGAIGINPITRSARLPDVVIYSPDGDPGRTIESVTVRMDQGSSEGLLPDFLSITFDEAQFVDAPSIQGVKDQYGVDLTDRDLNASFSWDRNDVYFDVKGDFSVEGYGELRGDFVLHDPSDAWVDFQTIFSDRINGAEHMNPEVLQSFQQSFDEVGVNNFNAIYEDDGAIDHFMGRVSHQMFQGDRDAANQAAVSILSYVVEDQESIKAFVESPKRISFALHREEPLGIDMLQQIERRPASAAQLINGLDLRIQLYSD